MWRASLVAAMFLGASFMAASALAGDEDQPRLIPAEWVWNPYPYPGQWEWRERRRERRHEEYCWGLRRRLDYLRDRPRWERNWERIREVEWRLRNDCPGYSR